MSRKINNLTAKKLLFTVGAHEGLKSGSETGRNGVVKLPLNTARNQVMRQSEAWNDLDRFVKEQGKASLIGKQKNLSREEIMTIWSKLGASDLKWKDFMRHDIFLATDGKAYSLHKLNTSVKPGQRAKSLARRNLNGTTFCCFSVAEDSIGDRVSQARLAVVFDKQIAEAAGSEEFVLRELDSSFRCREVFELLNEVDYEFKSVDPSEYTYKEKRVLAMGMALKRIEALVWAASEGDMYRCVERQFSIGESHPNIAAYC